MEDVDYAFYNLSRFILRMIYFSRYGYRNMLYEYFCLMMTQGTFWNFLDIRLLEAIALASMIPAAQKSVENYKRAFFNKKISDVIRDYQYQPFMKFIGDRNETLHESIENLHSKQITIGDLHKHRLYLETSLFHVGEGNFALYQLHIYFDSLLIVWQIHVDLLH